MTGLITTGRSRPEVGRSRMRKEDARLVTGRTTWTDNITVPGLLHPAILRSPMAHAYIDRADVSPALERPGVVAAFTGRDLAGELGRMPCVWPVTEDIVMPDHPAVAVDEVRYVGDPVALVIARDRYAAADALEGRLHTPAARPRPGIRTGRRRPARPRRQGHQPLLHLAARHGRLRSGEGPRRRRTPPSLHPAAPHPQCHGPQSRRRHTAHGLRRIHPVLLDPGPARGPGHPVHGHRDPRTETAGDRPGRRRRLRQAVTDARAEEATA